MLLDLSKVEEVELVDHLVCELSLNNKNIQKESSCPPSFSGF